jgi:hypothetical protein
MPNRGRVSPLYEYRETALARQQLDALAVANSQFQALWEAFLWIVLRNPYKGTPVPAGTPHFIIKTQDFLALSLPILFVVYCIPAPTIVEVVEVRMLP